MKASSSNMSKQGQEEEEEEGATEHKRLQLQKRFNKLELEWHSIKKSNPRSSKAMVRTVQYTNNSPRSLMSTLQRSNRKAISTTWKVRTNDVAVDDILRERRAAMESGELKGRSLLEAFEGAICNELPGQDPEEVRLVDYSDFDGYEVEVEDEDDPQYHVWEVKSTSSSSSPVCCCDCSSCFCSSAACEGDRMSEEHKNIVDDEIESKNKGWWKAFKPWLATCVALLGLISAMAIFDYGDDKVFQVPT